MGLGMGLFLTQTGSEPGCVCLPLQHDVSLACHAPSRPQPFQGYPSVRTRSIGHVPQAPNFPGASTCHTQDVWPWPPRPKPYGGIHLPAKNVLATPTHVPNSQGLDIYQQWLVWPQPPKSQIQQGHLLASLSPSIYLPPSSPP